MRKIKHAIFLTLGVVLTSGLFWTGHQIGIQSDRAQLIAAIWNHVGVGTLLAPFLISYLGFRVAHLFARNSSFFESLIFFGFTAMALFLVFSGPFVVWTYGVDLKVFDWIAIGSPTGKMPDLHAWTERVHKVIGKLIIGVMALDAILFALRLCRQRTPPIKAAHQGGPDSSSQGAC